MKKNKKNRRRQSYGHALKAKGMQTGSTVLGSGVDRRDLLRRIQRDAAKGRPWPCAHRQCDADALLVIEVPSGLLAVCDVHRAEALEAATAMNLRAAKAGEIADQDQRLAKVVQNCDGSGVVSGAAGEGQVCEWPDCGQPAIHRIWVIKDRVVQFDAPGCNEHHSKMLDNITAPPNDDPASCASDLQTGFNRLGWHDIDPMNDMVLNNGGVVLMPCPHCEWAGKSHILRVQRTGATYSVQAAS